MNRSRQLSATFVVAALLTISLIFWVCSELLSSSGTANLPIIGVWIAGIAFVALLLQATNLKKIRSMRTIAFSDHVGFCPGYGQFAYSDSIDFIEASLLASVNATYANKPLQPPLAMNANFVLKTSTLGYSILQQSGDVLDNRGQASSPVDPNNIGEFFSKAADAAFLPQPENPLTNSSNIAVSNWSGSLERVEDGKKWHFDDLNELEEILQQVF